MFIRDQYRGNSNESSVGMQMELRARPWPGLSHSIVSEKDGPLKPVETTINKDVRRVGVWWQVFLRTRCAIIVNIIQWNKEE